LKRHEVVVAFDGGVSPTVKRYVDGLRAKLPTMHIVETERQLGFAGAANRAVAMAQGDILVFTDSDVFPAPGAIEALASFVAEHDDVGAAQGLLLYPQTLVVQSAGHLIFDFWNFHVFEDAASARPVTRQTADRQALSAAFLAVRRELFDRHNGFDEFYFNGWEGMELTVKIHLSGYRCVFFPQAYGYHVRGSARGRQPQ
jgi:GT2 family glycosyltransferase